MWLSNGMNRKPKGLSDDLFQYVKDRESSYGIEIHEPGEKSTASNISNSRPSEIYLNCIGRETSKTAFEINTSYSDEENMVLLHKTEKLKLAVEKELDDVKKQLESAEGDEKIGLEAYKKKLIRYRKFFKYRNYELTIRANGIDKEIKSDFIETLKKVVNNKQLDLFFESFTEDVFSVLLSLVLREMTNAGEDISELLGLVDQLNTLLFKSDNKKTSYLYQAFSRYFDSEIDANIEDVKYLSLKKRVTNQMLFFHKKKDDFRRTHMEKEQSLLW